MLTQRQDGRVGEDAAIDSRGNGSASGWAEDVAGEADGYEKGGHIDDLLQWPEGWCVFHDDV